MTDLSGCWRFDTEDRKDALGGRFRRSILAALMVGRGPWVTYRARRGVMLDTRICQLTWGPSDVSRTLHEAALDWATEAMADSGDTDPRLALALQAKAQWLEGQISTETLQAARARVPFCSSSYGARRHYMHIAEVATYEDPHRAAHWTAYWLLYEVSLRTAAHSLPGEQDSVRRAASTAKERFDADLEARVRAELSEFEEKCGEP